MKHAPCMLHCSYCLIGYSFSPAIPSLRRVRCKSNKWNITIWHLITGNSYLHSIFFSWEDFFSILWNLRTSLVCISLRSFLSGASGEKYIYYSELAGRCDGLGHVYYAATLQNRLRGTARLQGQTSFFPLLSRSFLVSGQKKGEWRERGKERLLLLSALSALSASVSQTEMPRLFTDLVAKILIS